MKPRLHFSRFEFKYVLTQKQREALESEIQYFVELDPFTAGREGGRYFVRSLYFDDRSLTHYKEKVDGQMHRQKFRLRTYTNTEGDGTPRFLEIKGRYNNLVFKHRTPVKDGMDYDGPDNGFQNPVVAQLLSELPEGPIRDQFEFDSFRKRLRPAMLVDYWRRPYVSKYDAEFRITFDEQLSGTITNSLFPRPEDKRLSCIPGRTIVEVKFRYSMPKWFHRLIQSQELRRVSISKYCETIETHGLAPRID